MTTASKKSFKAFITVQNYAIIYFYICCHNVYNFNLHIQVVFFEVKLVSQVVFFEVKLM